MRIWPFWTTVPAGLAGLQEDCAVGREQLDGVLPGGARQGAPDPRVGAGAVPDLVDERRAGDGRALRPQIEVVLQAEEVVLQAGLGGAVGELAVLVAPGLRRVGLDGHDDTGRQHAQDEHERHHRGQGDAALGAQHGAEGRQRRFSIVVRSSCQPGPRRGRTRSSGCPCSRGCCPAAEVAVRVGAEGDGDLHRLAEVRRGERRREQRRRQHRIAVLPRVVAQERRAAEGPDVLHQRARGLVGVPGNVMLGGVPVPTKRRRMMSPAVIEISWRSGLPRRRRRGSRRRRRSSPSPSSAPARSRSGTPASAASRVIISIAIRPRWEVSTRLWVVREMPQHRVEDRHAAER